MTKDYIKGTIRKEVGSRVNKKTQQKKLNSVPSEPVRTGIVDRLRCVLRGFWSK